MPSSPPDSPVSSIEPKLCTMYIELRNTDHTLATWRRKVSSNSSSSANCLADASALMVVVITPCFGEAIPTRLYLFAIISLFSNSLFHWVILATELRSIATCALCSREQVVEDNVVLLYKQALLRPYNCTNENGLHVHAGVHLPGHRLYLASLRDFLIPLLVHSQLLLFLDYSSTSTAMVFNTDLRVFIACAYIFITLYLQNFLYLFIYI